MIVRFHLERGSQSIANINDTRVFTRPLQHLRRSRRQPAQMHFARLVGAVLAPHHAEDAELGEIRLAPENCLNASVLFGGEAVLGRQFLRNSDFSIQHVFEYNQLAAFAVGTVHRERSP